MVKLVGLAGSQQHVFLWSTVWENDCKSRMSITDLMSVLAGMTSAPRDP